VKGSDLRAAAFTDPTRIAKPTDTNADFLADNRVVFNIKGNHYRLIAQIKYGPLFLVYIRFVGTHAEYDRVDASKV
jgi:mRNA interferase HigB